MSIISKTLTRIRELSNENFYDFSETPVRLTDRLLANAIRINNESGQTFTENNGWLASDPVNIHYNAPISKKYIVQLCNLGSEQKIDRIEQKLFTCSQGLRKLPYELGYLPIARTLLRSLIVNSSNESIKSMSRDALQDSSGDALASLLSNSLLHYLTPNQAPKRDYSDEQDQDIGLAFDNTEAPLVTAMDRSFNHLILCD